MIQHPHWYIALYQEIFARPTSVYTNEVSLINSIAALTEKDILEIGPGKGGHTREIITYPYNSLMLVDLDIDAIDYLNHKFGENKKIEIVNGDGFNLQCERYFNIIICMYSIILIDTSELAMLIQKINRLLSLTKPGGSVLFEVIDKTKSQHVYPHGQSNIVYQKDEDCVSICSYYSNSTIKIEYTGKYNDQEIAYSVELLGIDSHDLSLLSGKLGSKEVSISPLDEFSRRLLVSVRS